MRSDHTRLFLVWTAINLVFSALGLTITLVMLGKRSDQHAHFVRLSAAQRKACTRVAPASPSPDPGAPIAAPKTAPPRSSPPESGGAEGIDISPAMRLNLEALRSGASGDSPRLKVATQTLRLGSPTVLPPGKIHVINLWATWCDPCLAELPELKAMFARHRGWDDVRFVPIQVKDHADPLRTYQDYAGVMPPAPLHLADRTMSDALVTTLATNPKGVLYRDKIPVTLVLDCNRRVRWTKFEQLDEGDFVELERMIGRLREELSDTRPGAWCTQEWPGNGRCEPIERTPAHHSFEDCGPLRVSSGPLASEPIVSEPPEAEPIVVTTPPLLPTTCPPKTRLRHGKCSRLQKIPDLRRVDEPLLAICGDGACNGDETRSTCCQDCPCSERFLCRSLRPGEAPRCRAILQLGQLGGSP